MRVAGAWRRAALGAALLVSVGVDPAAARQDGDPVPLDPAVRTGALPNGLTFYIRQNGRPAARADLRLVIRAGSVLEDDDQLGYAHYVEHMAFNGTGRFARQELVRYLESIGMRFGAHLNAYTSFDETVYLLQVPTDSAALLVRGIEILEEWAQGVRFEAEEVARERGVVIEEWRGRLGAEARIQDRHWPAIFGESRYATRLPIGTLASLQQADSTGLVRFYRDWYRPDLMAVVAVGDFNPDTVEVLIRRHFAGLAMPADPRPRPAYPVTPPAGPRVAVATDAEAQSTSVAVLAVRPAESTRTTVEWRRDLVDQVVAQALNTRLAELAQQADPPFLGAGGGTSPLVAGADAWILSAVVAESRVMDGLAAAWREAERLRRFGLTQGELDRARADILRAAERGHIERDQRQHGGFAGAYVAHFLTGAPSPSLTWRYEQARALLPAITLDEVNAAARSRVLPGGAPVVLVGAPEKPGVAAPTREVLLATLAAVQAEPLTAYRETLDDAPLVPSPPAGGRVVQATLDSVLDIHDWRLSNGARVLIKPTAFRDDQVLLTAFSLGGLSRAAEPARLGVQLATVVPLQGGVGRFSAVDLGKALAGTTAQVTPIIGLTDEGVSGSSAPADLEVFFQLLWLYLTEPRVDSAAFQAFTAQVREVLQNRGASPDAAFSDTLQATLGQYHPLARPLTADRLGELDLGEALAFYRDRFADAGQFTWVIVGRVDPDALRPLVERWIGGLPAPAREDGWRDLGMRRPEGVVERRVYRGIEPQSRTALVLHGPMTYTREQRFALDAVREVLDVRLRDVVREALGGTYGVSVGASTTQRPREEYTLTIQFSADPARMDSLAAVVLAEVARLKAEGATAAEVVRITETRRRDREVAMRENQFWLTLLEATAREAETPAAALAEQERLIRDLSPARLTEAARRYLDTTRMVRVTLYPESQATPPPED